MFKYYFQDGTLLLRRLSSFTLLVFRFYMIKSKVFGGECKENNKVLIVALHSAHFCFEFVSINAKALNFI